MLGPLLRTPRGPIPARRSGISRASASRCGRPRGVNEIACSLLTDLLALPGVHRVGFALSEGGGRRLRFVGSDSLAEESLDWCLIDAYDDVPLTAVVRTGEPVLGSMDELERRFRDVVARQRDEGTEAMAVWPLPGNGTPMGGIVAVLRHRPVLPGHPPGAAGGGGAPRLRGRTPRARRHQPEGDDPWTSAEDADDGERASVLLASDPRSVGIARGFLRETLAEWDVDEDPIDTAQLCLSELVTNVVMHAGTTCELTVRLEDETLTVVVRDLGGERRPAGRLRPGRAGRGRRPAAGRRARADARGRPRGPLGVRARRHRDHRLVRARPGRRRRLQHPDRLGPSSRRSRVGGALRHARATGVHRP